MNIYIWNKFGTIYKELKMTIKKDKKILFVK
jgi:hypothetical protein